MNTPPPEPSAAVTDPAAYLRRRPSQMIDGTDEIGHAPQAAQAGGGQGSAGPSISSNAGLGHLSAPISMANRRPTVRAMTQADYSLSLTALTAVSPSASPPLGPTVLRSTTPTPAANSPLSTPFGKRRAADEVQAVADMLKNGGLGMSEAGGSGSNSLHATSSSTGIQRPASAPPRGRRRSSQMMQDLDDAGADAIEKAASNRSPASDKVMRSSPSLTEIAAETIEQFAAHLSDRSLAILFFFIVAWGAVLSLDRLTTYSYQTIVTNSFSHHSSLAEVNVVRGVVAAVAALPFATIADLGGRAQAFTIGLVLYAAGHAAMAGSTSVRSYTGGVVLYELGANGLVCLQSTVLADMTSSRNRLFFQILPQTPFMVFSFISSDIYSAILPQWRWGIGLFAILGPAALLPVITILGQSQREFKSPAVTSTQSARRVSLQQTNSSLSYTFLMVKHVFQAADMIGLLLLAGALSLSLVPLTLASSAPDRWEDPKILGMLSAGISLMLFFCYWELRQARNPIVPKLLLRNRTFWSGALGLCFAVTAHSIMLAYYPTYLYVVHGVSNRAQQNLSVIYSFTVAAASLPIALIVRHVRRFKVIIVCGMAVFTAGLATMIGFHGTTDSRFTVAMSQVVIGLGGALTIALIQAAVQVSVPHALVAQTIATLNIFPCVGNAIGSAIAGAMWSSLLPGKLARSLSPTGHLNELPTIYAEPLTWIVDNPLNTTTRTAVVNAYVSCWRVMMIVATLVCASSLCALIFAKNVRLSDAQSADGVVNSDAARAYSGDGRDGGIKRGNRIETDSGRLFGDKLFERFEDALGRRLVRRVVNKKSTPESPTDTKVTPMLPIVSSGGVGESSSSKTSGGGGGDDAQSRWKDWTTIGRLSRRQSRDLAAPSLAGLAEEGGATSGDGQQLPSPIEESGPAPILVVDEAPFVPIVSPPTPPATRNSIRALSPLSAAVNPS